MHRYVRHLNCAKIHILIRIKDSRVTGSRLQRADTTIYCLWLAAIEPVCRLRERAKARARARVNNKRWKVSYNLTYSIDPRVYKG